MHGPVAADAFSDVLGTRRGHGFSSYARRLHPDGSSVQQLYRLCADELLYGQEPVAWAQLLFDAEHIASPLCSRLLDMSAQQLADGRYRVRPYAALAGASICLLAPKRYGQDPAKAAAQLAGELTGPLTAALRSVIEAGKHPVVAEADDLMDHTDTLFERVAADVLGFGLVMCANTADRAARHRTAGRDVTHTQLRKALRATVREFSGLKTSSELWFASTRGYSLEKLTPMLHAELGAQLDTAAVS